MAGAMWIWVHHTTMHQFTVSLYSEPYICRIHTCLAVTCYLHFRQNDWDHLHAAEVTRGWNRYCKVSNSLHIPQDQWQSAIALHWPLRLARVWIFLAPARHWPLFPGLPLHLPGLGSAEHARWSTSEPVPLSWKPLPCQPVLEPEKYLRNGRKRRKKEGNAAKSLTTDYLYETESPFPEIVLTGNFQYFAH